MSERDGDSKNKAPAKEQKADSPAGRSIKGTPNVWQRCLTCKVKKKCEEAGVVRGSDACIEARYVSFGGKK